MERIAGGFARRRSIMVRLTDREHELIKQASAGSRSVSDYVRSVVVNASRAKSEEVVVRSKSKQK